MLDHPEFARWLESSDDEMRVAKELTRLDAFNATVLHSEQAAQMALKGLLRGVGLGEHAWGHSLTELAERASEHAGLDISEKLTQALVVLERDYMPTRYPDALVTGTPLGNYSPADAERATTTSEDIRSLVVETWERPPGRRRDGAGMSPASTQQILKRRRSERAALLSKARRFADALDSSLGIRTVVVFGSVARGDFNTSSDVDVLVIADHLPGRALDRNDALGIPPARVSFVVWTTEEWSTEKLRRNPIVLDVEHHGVLLRGGLP